MSKLLYKEFKLNINPLFYLATLLGALILIPNWLYFIAMVYVFFVTITNVMMISKSQNDFGYCAMLPIKKIDIVKARIMSMLIVELLHIAVAAIFAIINSKLYTNNNFFFEPNYAFFGFVFIMYSIFNIIFFPMYYKTGHKIGIPSVVSMGAAFIFAAAAEICVLLIPELNTALDSDSAGTLIWKLITLLIGASIFVLTGIISYKLSAKRFEKIGL